MIRKIEKGKMQKGFNVLLNMLLPYKNAVKLIMSDNI